MPLGRNRPPGDNSVPLEQNRPPQQYCPHAAQDPRRGLSPCSCGLLLSSCGARAVGYGVVLWGETTGAPATGAVVAIVQESTIGSAVLIAVPGERKPREYPAGRIRSFRKKSEAEAFAAVVRAEPRSWAVVMKEDTPPLPVRDAADAGWEGRLQAAVPAAGEGREQVG